MKYHHGAIRKSHRATSGIQRPVAGSLLAGCDYMPSLVGSRKAWLPASQFIICSHVGRDPRRGTGLVVAHYRPLRLGAARRHEAGAGLRLRRRTGSTDARVDEGAGLPDRSFREPAEVPALRIAAGAASLFGVADDATDAGLNIERIKRDYGNCALQNNLRLEGDAGVVQW